MNFFYFSVDFFINILFRNKDKKFFSFLSRKNTLQKRCNL